MFIRPAIRRSRVRPASVLLGILFGAGLCPAVHANPAALPAPGPFQNAEPGYRYRFPYDHGAHDRFRTEWWYYTGHLTAENGRRFGYQVTFFRRATEPERIGAVTSQWAIRHLYLAHVALSDLDRKRFRYAEKVSRAGLGKAGTETGRLRVWIDRWSVEADDSPHERHRLRAAAGDFSLDLTVSPEKPPVVHGERGVSRKGADPSQASHYYSFSRLATSGTLVVDGERLSVRGTSWMDHEFGSGDLGEDLAGWDWFSIQLDGGTELMLYRLRRTDGAVAPVSSGTAILPDGRTRHLPLRETQVEVLDHWTSQASGARYPARWRVTVPALALTLDIRPLLPDQELITSHSTQVTYWEGAVEIAGRLRDAPVSGQGYVELTGYAKPMRRNQP